MHIQHAIYAQASPPDVVATLVDWLRPLLPTDRLTILVVDSAQGEFETHSAFCTQVGIKSMRIPLSFGLVGIAARTFTTPWTCCTSSTGRCCRRAPCRS